MYAGRDKRAEIPTVITYPGLRAYSYDLVTTPDGAMQVRIWSVGYPDANAPHFRLVHNPTRLPLFIGDGDPVTCMKIRPTTDAERQAGTDLYQHALPSEAAFQEQHGGQDAAPGWGVVNATAEDATWWVDNTRLSGGYLRLFINDPDTDLPDRVERDAASGSTGSAVPSAGTSGTHTHTPTGFSSGAFGGSLATVPGSAGATASAGSAGSAFPTGSPGTAGTTSTWHAASIPGVIIEGAVASRLAVPDRGRMM